MENVCTEKKELIWENSSEFDEKWNFVVEKKTKQFCFQNETSDGKQSGDLTPNIILT